MLGSQGFAAAGLRDLQNSERRFFQDLKHTGESFRFPSTEAFVRFSKLDVCFIAHFQQHNKSVLSVSEDSFLKKTIMLSMHEDTIYGLIGFIEEHIHVQM